MAGSKMYPGANRSILVSCYCRIQTARLVINPKPLFSNPVIYTALRETNRGIFLLLA